jgi:hypothetical protein
MHVDHVRNGLQVHGIDAPTVSAEVVEFQPLGHRAVGCLVSVDVGEGEAFAATAALNLAVALGSPMA